MSIHIHRLDRYDPTVPGLPDEAENIYTIPSYLPPSQSLRMFAMWMVNRNIEGEATKVTVQAEGRRLRVTTDAFESQVESELWTCPDEGCKPNSMFICTEGPVAGTVWKQV